MEANIWHLCEFKRPILDIGIGNGRLTPLIFKNVKQFDVGIDIDEEGLDPARSSGIYKKVMLENAEKMSFKDESFKTIVSNSTFEHIKHDKKAIREVARTLKKNGTFMFTVPSNYLKEWIYEKELEKTNSKSDAKRNLQRFNERANHLHYKSLDEWKKLLNEAGLEIVFSSHYFKKDSALLWYRLFKLFTKKINNKELWSYFQSSKLSFFIPKEITKRVVKQLLQKPYNNGFLVGSEEGAQLVIIAKKV